MLGADRVSGSEKGSLLVLSRVELRWDAQGRLVRDTFLGLTNDWPGEVAIKLFFINGDAPLDEPAARLHPGWNWVDTGITLTRNQPTYWSAASGQPGPSGAALPPFTVLDPAAGGATPGRPDPDGSADRVLRGFVYAWAVDAQEREISWNHLQGEATIVDYRSGTAWEYRAWAFQDAQDRAPGSVLEPPFGELDLDGVEYVPGFAQLQMGFFAAGSTALSGGGGQYESVVTLDTELTLHPVRADLRQEGGGPVTTKASFTIWNEDETQLTGLDRCITCWDQSLLSVYVNVGNHFLVSNLQTDRGRARIDGVAGAVDCGQTATAVSLLGVIATHLRYDDGVRRAVGGTSLIGLGREPHSAAIRCDPIAGGGP